ncbi:MAG: LysR family transcriptional regulator [Azospirillaceae bacterium]|nr:LysR family transcriptional regulator [Azospirillaceae bacterium]
MEPMELDWLKDFLALADCRNFSRAADLRNVTQPAFSRRIRALEDWVGVPLFVRGAQGAGLTPAGDHFRPLAVELIQGLDRARRDTRAVGEGDRGALSIAATHALSFTFFPGWVRGRLRLETLGALNLVSDSMQACEQLMQAGAVHFLLSHFHPKAPPRLDAERFPSLAVGDDVLVPLSAPDAEGRPRWPVPGRADRPTPRLAYSPASGLGRIVASHPALGAEGLFMAAGFTSHLAATLMTMARDGHGVAWLPRTLAAEDLSAGRLVRAAPEAFDIAIEIRLFRSLDCRNRAADELWATLVGDTQLTD